MRDSSGALAPQGTVVRFTGVPTSANQAEMLVGNLASTSFSAFTAGETDASGRTGVLVQMGQIAGPARIAISVPTIAIQDTARFTVLPGRAVRVTLAPADTAVYAGRTFTLRGGVVDRFGNVRNDPVTYAASAPGVTVSGTGVVSAAAAGRFTVTATAGTFTGSSGVSVVPEGMIAAAWNPPAGGFRIVSVGLDGSGFRDLTTVSDGGIGPRPRWIPGTNTIVYSHYDGTYQLLRTVDQDGRVSPFIATPPGTMTHQAEPSPSLTAPVIYFSAYDSRCSAFVYCLHRAGRDGTAPELLGLHIGPNQVSWRPSASPDGSKVAYVGNGPTIRVFDYQTKTSSSWGVPGQHPSWSPDGTRIAYVTGFSGSIRVINADGTGDRAVTSGSRMYTESPLSWTSDSKWVLARTFSSGVHDLIDVQTGSALPLPFTIAYGNASLK